MSKYAVVVFDTHLHEISVPGSHYTLIVPGATNEEVLDILVREQVSVWHKDYLVRAIRVLKEAGYEPVPIDGVVGVNPHEREVYTVHEYQIHGDSHLALDVVEDPSKYEDE